VRARTLPIPKRDTGTIPAFDHVQGHRANVVLYRRGARVMFASKYGGHEPEPREAARVIRDQSTPSRQRAAFAFGNAECDWLAMTTLTWHAEPSPELVKSTLSKFRRAWRGRWLEPLDGWIMEMQERGVPHFHLFHAAQSEAGKIIFGMPRRSVRRKGRQTELVGGSFENWMIQTWLACTGQSSDLDAISFSRGGIVEFFRTPDAAGRYIAKESAKRGQKELPEVYAAGLGRWWWLNPRWHPRSRSVHSADMTQWPWAVPLARVWESSDLAAVIRPADPLPPAVTSGRIYTLRRKPYVSTMPPTQRRLSL